MKRLLAGAVLVGSIGLLALPPAGPAAAEPVTTTSTGLPDDLERCAPARDRADRALAGLTTPQPYPWVIEWRCGTPGQTGQADPASATITVWVEAHDSVQQAEWIIVHELGHVADFELLDDDDRDAWQALRGLDGSWWSSFSLDNPTYETWIQGPAEDFAESFAACQLGAHPGRSDLFTPPSAAQCDLLAGLTGVPVSAAPPASAS